LISVSAAFGSYLSSQLLSQASWHASFVWPACPLLIRSRFNCFCGGVSLFPTSTFGFSNGGVFEVSWKKAMYPPIIMTIRSRIVVMERKVFIVGMVNEIF